MSPFRHTAQNEAVWLFVCPYNIPKRKEVFNEQRFYETEARFPSDTFNVAAYGDINAGELAV